MLYFLGFNICSVREVLIVCVSLGDCRHQLVRPISRRCRHTKGGEGAKGVEVGDLRRDD